MPWKARRYTRGLKNSQLFKADLSDTSPAGIAVMLLFRMLSGGLIGLLPAGVAGAEPSFQTVHAVGAKYIIGFIGRASVGFGMITHGVNRNACGDCDKTGEQQSGYFAYNSLYIIAHDSQTSFPHRH